MCYCEDWACRDYQVDGQYGLEDNPQEYIDNIVRVMKECKRVLKPTGTIWLNIGDCFYTKSGSGEGSNYKKRHEQLSHGSDRLTKAQNQTRGKYKSNWLQTKQKLLIPQRIAIRCQDELGLILRNDITWLKQYTNWKTKKGEGCSMPSSVADRFGTNSEKLFLFVKKPKHYFFDLDAVRVPHKESSIKRIIYAQKVVQRLGKDFVSPNDKRKGQENKMIEQITEYKRSKSLNPKGKNPGDMLMFPQSKFNSIDEEAKNREGMYRGREKEIIEFRPLLPSQKEFVKELREHFSIEDIVKKTGIQKTKVEHWFRNDENGFSYPSKEDWEIVLEKFKSNLLRKELTETSFKSAYIDKNPKGKNPGDVIMFPLEPSKENHYAMFPTTLPDFCIRAGCPEEVCSKCGKPRVKITKKVGEYDYANKSEYANHQLNLKKPSNDWKPIRQKVIGYKECDCKVDGKKWIPGIVLDPFAGLFTTGLVARRLKRRFIGIELNPEYIKLAWKRMGVATENKILESIENGKTKTDKKQRK